MPVRKDIQEKEGVYFLTFTCTRWLPLFRICSAYDAVFDWFDHLKKGNHYIIGYVIMPHHVHALVAFCNTGKSINTIIANGKRFIAYDIVERLEKGNQLLILDELNNALNPTERKEGKKHAVFETSFDWKECRTVKFIEQKPDYLHWNPCRAGLVRLAEEYAYSSAKYYLTGKQEGYPVTSFMDLEDIDLTGGVR